MSKRKESKATPLDLITATIKSNAHFEVIVDATFIGAWFQCKDHDTNGHLFSIVKYMREYLEELDDTHAILFSYLEKLKANLLERNEGYVEDEIDIQCLPEITADNCIISLIQSVLDNPSSIEEDKDHLLHILQACIYAIRSKNDRELDKIKARLDRMKAKYKT